MSRPILRLALGAIAAGIITLLSVLSGAAPGSAQSDRHFLPLGLSGPAQETPHPTVTREPTVAHHPTVTPHPTRESTAEPHPTATGVHHPTACPTAEPPTGEPKALAVPVVVVAGGIDPADWFRDAVTISSAAIQGDVLTLEVSYGGGCREHDLWLVASSLFMESAPPQVNALLSHNAYGDACRAIIHRTLAFDLAPLRRTATGAADTRGTLILRLAGWEAGIRYDY